MVIPLPRWAPAAYAACAVAALALAPAVHADTLGNGGFESGGFDGWTTQGDLSFVGVDTGFAHSGNYAAFFGPETPAGISQDLATSAGQLYRVSFWLALPDSAQPNTFSWQWNGVQQALVSNATAFGYTEFTGFVSASGASSSLRLSFENPQAFWLLDDVSVTAVPEPGALALMALGVATLALRRRSLAR